MKKFFRDTVVPILDGMASTLILFPRPKPPKMMTFMTSSRRIKTIKLTPLKKKKEESD